MRASFILGLSLAAGIALASPASAFEPGDWVLGQWRGGEYWFPGIVKSASGGKVTLRYDDGELETRPHNQIKPYDWRVGTRVECNFQGQGKWYSGQIAALDAGRARIHYDDGDKENTTTGRCRSR